MVNLKEIAQNLYYLIWASFYLTKALKLQLLVSGINIVNKMNCLLEVMEIEIIPLVKPIQVHIKSPMAIISVLEVSVWLSIFLLYVMFVNDKQLDEISFTYVKAREQPTQPKMASYLGGFNMNRHTI